jgi:hypothetical protein
LNWLLDDASPITDQPLTLAALERVVAQVADRPELWEPHVERTSPRRSYASLYRDARVDVWAILWRPGNETTRAGTITTRPAARYGSWRAPSPNAS